MMRRLTTGRLDAVLRPIVLSFWAPAEVLLEVGRFERGFQPGRCFQKAKATGTRPTDKTRKYVSG
ncbi:MAG TPA: hypothetical protein VMX13_07440 [Sedimentisphaerales bacterium]|nr:hypothetical protein [Sedimentisphaerales bacterium]